MHAQEGEGTEQRIGRTVAPIVSAVRKERGIRRSGRACERHLTTECRTNGGLLGTVAVLGLE